MMRMRFCVITITFKSIDQKSTRQQLWTEIFNFDIIFLSVISFLMYYIYRFNYLLITNESTKHGTAQLRIFVLNLIFK